MKNKLAVVSTILLFIGCAQPVDQTPILNTRIDSLEKKLAETYKPGLGEFMSSIQVHHAKLWFAGTNENWKLADFEINEIKESIDDIMKFQSERKETEQLHIVNPALDSITISIQLKNEAKFKSGFVFLTKTCNNCHQSTDHGFNMIKIPDAPPFSNQSFKEEK